jgi:DNA polymerase elongation subunit (family B)
MKDIAACTTATGRKMILMAKEYIEKKATEYEYAYEPEVVYGDTDSLFIKFEFKDANGNPIKGHEAIPLARNLGIKVSNEFKKFIKPPHDLEWEKLFYPFILFSKKRYCANKYEHDDHKYKMNSMGIVLKRRDNAPIVKTIYGGILNIILNEQNIKKSIAFLRDNLQLLIDGKFPLEELIITKSLKSDYKDPEKIAHKALADRMRERDEGSAPQVNDRVPFVYVQTASTSKKILQGERIEHPDWIKAQSLKPDYDFYITNQIMKPCLQLYALILEQLDGYKKNVDYVDLKTKLIKDKDGDVKKAKDKWNDLREGEVKKLLFDPFLIKLQNKKNKNTAITDFFKVKD